MRVAGLEADAGSRSGIFDEDTSDNLASTTIYKYRAAH